MSTQFNKSGATGGAQKPSEPTPIPTGSQEPAEEETKPLPESEPLEPTDPFKEPMKEEPIMEKEPEYESGVEGMDKYGEIGGNGGGDYELGGM